MNTRTLPGQATAVAPRWRTRLRAVLRAAWSSLGPKERDARDRYFAQSSDCADLERRIRHWHDAERRPWLPPR